MAAKVLILCGDPRSEAELAELVRGAGGWVAATATPDAFDPSDARDFDLIVADLRGFGAPEGIGDVRVPMIAEIDREAIDLAAVALETAQLLVDPDPIERGAAIAVALAWSGGSVREGAQTGLRQLSEDAGRIARALAALAETNGAITHPLPLDRPAAVLKTAAFVRSLIRKRRLRDRFFAAEIFADPAWDILLDLYAARLEGAQVAVSSLCIAAHVPPTTALRWIGALTEQGLLNRIADPNDRRRIFIALSDGAADRMAAYLSAAEG